MLYDNFTFCHNQVMKAPRRRSSHVFTISFPKEMAKQVIAVANEENRTISELFREAFRTYRSEQMRKRLEMIRTGTAKRVKRHFTEEDVEAIVDEIRSEHFSKRKKTA